MEENSIMLEVDVDLDVKYCLLLGEDRKVGDGIVLRFRMVYCCVWNASTTILVVVVVIVVVKLDDCSCCDCGGGSGCND